MADDEITIKIIESQNYIIKLINKINPNTSCNPCKYVDCEDIISIQRAILYNMQDNYIISNSASSSAEL